MGSKGNKRALKRLAVPKHVRVPRKQGKWFMKPRPGPHPKDFCLPLAHFLRDVLKYAHSYQEARKIIKERKILVDGRPITDPRFPVGLMDVVSIPTINEWYRVLADNKRGLILYPIDEKEADFKLCRIENKTTVTGGNIQLNLHDGRNILVEIEDPEKPTEDIYKTRDTLKISIPDQEILEHLEFKVPNFVMIDGGKNIGEVGKIENISKHYGPAADVVAIQNLDEEIVETALEYTFVLGKRKSRITIPQLEN